MGKWVSRNLAKRGLNDWATENQPTGDGADNDHLSDVVGNKTDTTSGNSLVALSKAIKAKTDNLLSNTVVSKAVTLNLGNASGSHNVFTITGAVEITRLYGVVTTVTFMANLTSGGLEIYDSTAATGLDDNSLVLSGLAVGTTFLCKDGNVATAPALLNNVARDVEIATFTPFAVIKKITANTYIRFEYQTTDTPINAVITFYAEYRALSLNGALEAV